MAAKRGGESKQGLIITLVCFVVLSLALGLTTYLGFSWKGDAEDKAADAAKKELKKRVRQVRGIERAVEGRADPEADVIRGYCSAVRGALTDDGRPPLEASGLKLHDRLQAIAQSLDRVVKKGGRRAN